MEQADIEKYNPVQDSRYALIEIEFIFDEAKDHNRSLGRAKSDAYEYVKRLLPFHVDEAKELFFKAGVDKAEVNATFDNILAQMIIEAPRLRHKDLALPEPYPIESIPEPIRQHAIEAANALDVDPCFTSLSLIAQAAAAIGTTRVASPKPGHYEPAILWCGIVAESGQKKSPAFKETLHAIEKADAELIDTYQAELEIYKAQIENGESVPKPPKKRLTVKDTTPEALADLLVDNPRGLLLNPDELSGWISGFDKYKARSGGEAAFWLSCWDGNRACIDRVSRGTQHIKRAAVSIIGGMQPAIMTKCFTEEHRLSGLLPRFLLAYPAHRMSFYNLKTVQSITRHNTATVIKELLMLEHQANTTNESTVKAEVVKLTDEAVQYFIDWQAGHAAANARGTYGAALSKMPGQALRLALVFRMVKNAEAALQNETIPPEQITIEDLQAATTIAEWHIREFDRILTLFTPEDGTSKQDEIDGLVRWIDKQGGATVRDVTRKVWVWRNRNDEAKTMLDAAVSLGRLTREQDGKTFRYTISKSA